MTANTQALLIPHRSSLPHLPNTINISPPRAAWGRCTECRRPCGRLPTLLERTTINPVGASGDGVGAMGIRVFSTVRLVTRAARRKDLFFFLPLLLLILLPLTAGCTDLGDSLAADESSSPQAFVQQQGEIFLEPAGTIGPEPFAENAGEVFLPPGAGTTIPTPAETWGATSTSTTGAASTTSAGTVQVASYDGDTPALYGGSKDKKLADKEGQLEFFEQHPEKAAAFCAALSSDPAFTWSDGTQIYPGQLRDYFAELTPLMLTRDTRVTNYGYRDGQPTPRQSVLQAGQMVLVDRYGVPRVRCECGNPLTPPQPVKKTPTYTGARWPDFDPTVVIVVQPTVVVIDVFVVIDIFTGEIFVRPAGTEGDQDRTREATVWQLTVSFDPVGGPLEWTAEIFMDEEGMLSGYTAETWHCHGYSWLGSNQNKTGNWDVDVNYTVDITGAVETAAEGRILHLTVVPTITSLENWVIVDERQDDAVLQSGVAGQMTGWLNLYFVPMDLPAVDHGPVFATLVAADDTDGSATLTALWDDEETPLP